MNEHSSDEFKAYLQEIYERSRFYATERKTRDEPDDPEGDGGGVREPRRPKPSQPGGEAALVLP